MKPETKIYQVVFCDCRPWQKASWNMALTEWHVLDCPLIGIRDIHSDADYLFGIKALRGANARQDAPSYVLEREEIEEELSRLAKGQ